MLYVKLKKGDCLDIKYQDSLSCLKVLDLYPEHWSKLIWTSDQSNMVMTVPAQTKFTSEVDGSPLHFYVLKASPSAVMLGVHSFDSTVNIKRRRIYNGC